jgi:O-antigen/teichoic acid export membrane protein
MNIKGDLLVRNTGLTFIARIVPMLVALVTIPYVIRGLGTERFGVLSLAWLVVGSASIFDFGIGRATTKFVAEALGKNQMDRLSTIVWTSLVSQVTLGIVAGIFHLPLKGSPL